MTEKVTSVPEKDGFKTIDLIAGELSLSEDKVRTLIAVLNLQPRTFSDDRRRRYYSPDDVERLRKLLDTER